MNLRAGEAERRVVRPRPLWAMVVRRLRREHLPEEWAALQVEWGAREILRAPRRAAPGRAAAARAVPAVAAAGAVAPALRSAEERVRAARRVRSEAMAELVEPAVAAERRETAELAVQPEPR